jgi:hypothetical protein
MADGEFILIYESDGRKIGPFDSHEIASAYGKERGSRLFTVDRLFKPGADTLNAAINRVARESVAPAAVLVAFTPEEAAYVARLVGGSPAGAAYQVARSAYRTLREFDTQAI